MNFLFYFKTTLIQIIFSILQRFNRVGLVTPEGAPHMWHADMESKTVGLTALGEHYRQLAAKELI